MIANATGCSSIYGGSAPSTPYTTNEEGKGPAWANSLFEDNAEFGLGYALANITMRDRIKRLMEEAIVGDNTPVNVKELFQAWIDNKSDVDKTKELYPQIVDELEKAHQNVQNIFSVERLDYSKGLPERFLAYEALLEKYPQHHGKIRYTQIAPTSRGDVQAYQDIRHQLENEAGRINGKYGQLGWTPLYYLNQHFDRKLLMKIFRYSDVGLVTPLRDGMNLVAKEYVAAQDPANPGVLVLSQFAGAANELTSA